MWSTDTYWFEVAAATSLLTLGNIFFGRFSEHQSRWLRVLKAIIAVGLVVGTSMLFGRVWIWALLGVLCVGILVVHGWWLPKKGVNGWTMEPRDRYYELVGLDQNGKRRTHVA
jgi:hypothetical protein